METTIRIAEHSGTSVNVSDNRLHEIRKAKHRTLRECAEAVGVTHQAIHKAERRADAMALSKWRVLAEFLDTALDELVCL